MKWHSIAYVLIALATPVLVRVAWLVKRTRKREAQATDRARLENTARERVQPETRADVDCNTNVEECEPGHPAAEAERLAEEKCLAEKQSAAETEARQEDRLESEAEAKTCADADAKAKADAEGCERERFATEAVRLAEEKHLAEERAAAEQEAQCQTEERRGAEEEARIGIPQEDKSAGIEAQGGRGKGPSRVAAVASEAIAEALAVPPEFDDPDLATFPVVTAPLSATLSEPATALRVPRQYRPTARVPAALRDAPAVSTEREARERAMPIEVRLVFEKAGFCRVSLLPRRAEGMPTELVMTGSGDPPELLSLQDDWYQDVVLPNLGDLLREGIEWAGSLPECRRVRASLSGREIYVLAPHTEISGFVSAPRLVLGEEHVVLCVGERLAEVRAAIALTGNTDPVLLSSDSGVPSGWSGLRAVVPRNPIAPSPTGEILDALRPLADVEIALVGGIRIDRQTWVTGFPPSVRLRGDTSMIGALTIDSHEATVTLEGNYVVPGWDSPGDHSVWCTSDSRTYSIRSGAEEWQAWDAYTWSLGEVGAEATRSFPGICGVLVRPPKVARSDGRAIVIPASNPVLIGAGPGEIEICTPRRDVRAGLCVGFPWFKPIWAIPADALRCDKRTGRVLLIGFPEPVAEGKRQPNSRLAERRSPGAYAWCDAILTAGRKGLQTEPSGVEITDLWKTYKRCAKALRRSWR